MQFLVVSEKKKKVLYSRTTVASRVVFGSVFDYTDPKQSIARRDLFDHTVECRVALMQSDAISSLV